MHLILGYVHIWENFKILLLFHKLCNAAFRFSKIYYMSVLGCL